MINDQLLLEYGSLRPWTMAANLVESLFKARGAATAPVTLSLFRNATLIGTINWAAGATMPTISFLFRIDFAIGDYFSVVGPAVADATLSDITCDFAAYRL
jgi:hypothetical protein